MGALGVWLWLAAGCSLAAVLLARFLPRSEPSALLLGLAAVLGGVGWFLVGRQGAEPPASVPLLAALAVVSSAAFWSVLRWPAEAGVKIILGLLLASAAAALALFPPPGGGAVDDALAQLWAECCFGASTGWLVAATVAKLAGAARSGEALALAALTALLLQSLGMVLYGAGMQRFQGYYGRCSATECWQLAVWLALAVLALGLRRLDWRGRGAFVAWLLVTALDLFVQLAGVAVVGALHPSLATAMGMVR
jgi:hypothetical protein